MVREIQPKSFFFFFFRPPLTENMNQFVGKRKCISGYKMKDVKNINHGIKLRQANMHVNCYNLNKKYTYILCFI